jgi:hypothetical protein
MTESMVQSRQLYHDSDCDGIYGAEQAESMVQSKQLYHDSDSVSNMLIAFSIWTQFTV